LQLLYIGHHNDNSRIHVWDLKSGSQELIAFSIVSAGVWCLEQNKDGTIYAGTSDNTIDVWTTTTSDNFMA
jgi:WD40 repeat protein